jgi:hypothetical protein
MKQKPSILYMRKFFFGCLIILSFATSAQKITVSGKVVDKETREPLVFASIGILGRSISTITNLQGEFDFHIPNEFRNDILLINMLGYKPYEAPVWTLLESKEILLEKSTTVLSELVFTDSLLGGDILHIALSRITQNYPTTPFLMDGFYRDVKKVADTYISLLEAAVKIYDEDYLEPRNKFKLRERVSLVEVRRSMGYENRFTNFFDQDNLLEDLLLHNTIRYRQFPEEEIFFDNLNREKNSIFNGQEVFVVSHTTDYLLRVFIDKKTYGIIHIDYESHNQESIGKKRGLNSRFVKLKRSIDFKWFEGKLFLNYLTVESQINWYNVKTNELKFETILNRQLLINQVFPNSPARIKVTQKMKNYGLQFQDFPYNKAFWDNYNVIKETPLDRKILEDLEKAGPLEKQFKN